MVLQSLLVAPVLVMLQLVVLEHPVALQHLVAPQGLLVPPSRLAHLLVSRAPETNHQPLMLESLRVLHSGRRQISYSCSRINRNKRLAAELGTAASTAKMNSSTTTGTAALTDGKKRAR